MSFTGTGDWRIVMLIDGTDTEGKATYQHIYQHQDGRKACVGPGFCSDPDLEWILFQKTRERKSWRRRQTKRERISIFMIFVAWSTILFQSVLTIPKNGAWFLFSLFGYWIIEMGSLGIFNNFRELFNNKRNDQIKQKIINFVIVSCFI